ncbi:MAG: nitrate/nitrite transporter NrtS [Thermodesulfobacteriota bacterium]
MKNFFRRETVVRALKVALVVGPILIVINHHDSLLSLELHRQLYFKIALTFLVPYCVSAYSSASAYCAEEARS